MLSDPQVADWQGERARRELAAAPFDYSRLCARCREPSPAPTVTPALPLLRPPNRSSVTRPTPRTRLSMKGFCRVALAFAVMSTLAVLTASGADAATSFCTDTAQLQSWIAQDFLPGIDQYNVHANPSYVRSLAQYLRKLGEEAPAAARADLTVWATFTESVADGASQPELVSGVQVARSAAERVKVWLATKSGCPQLYTKAPAPPTPDQNGLSYLPWVIVGVCAVVLLGAVGGQRTRSNIPSSGSRQSGNAPNSGNSRPEPTSMMSSKPAQKCGSCGGSGTQTCFACQGRGYITIPAYAPYAGTTQGWCAPCTGSGKTKCQMCSGTGHR